jgi:hypothetical protein
LQVEEEGVILTFDHNEIDKIQKISNHVIHLKDKSKQLHASVEALIKEIETTKGPLKKR